MPEHGSHGLNASGSLTEKDIQCEVRWQSSTNSGARDLLCELKQVLDASGINELRECMAALQDSMMNMEMLVAAQASKMGEMASVMQTLAKEPLAKETKARTGSHLSLLLSAPSSPAFKPEPQQVSAPGCPSQDPILLPTAIPNAMPMSPMGPMGPQNPHSKSSQSSRPHASGDSESEKPQPKNFGSFHSRRSGKSPGSSFGLDAFLGKRSPMLGIANLEDLQASQLLQSMRRSSRQKPAGGRQSSRQSEDPPRSSSPGAVIAEKKLPDRRIQHLAFQVEHVEPHPNDSSLLPNGKKKAHTMNSRLGGEDKAAVLGKCQRVSLEELRTNYDAAIAEFSTTKVSERRGEVSALPRIGRCLLCMAGHLRFSEGLASRCFAILSFGVIPMAMSGLLLYGGAVSFMDASLLLALTSFQLGVSVASFSFDRKGIGLLLGPQETRLDDYALEADFMADWQKVSRKRFIETVCMFIGMMCTRIAAQIWVRGQLDADIFESNWELCYSIAFSFMLFRYLLLCYSILHCCCGLELALDSFGVRFFREMDVEQALGEWNTLQATLRQASTKISDSLLVIGFCCLASMALLGEQVIRNPQSFVETPGRMTSWLSRYYPLMIAFLYTMMRAAAVTEKANRVAPLVNSWKFHKSHQEDDETGVWMDHERQYVVQYISQSRAGFFIRGSQLTVPTVQKLLYYLGAVSFALFSRLSAV